MEVDPVSLLEGTDPVSDPSPISASVVAAVAPRFASIHTLLVKLDSPDDLPEGSIWLRDEHGILEQRVVQVNTSARLAALHQAIAEGRVYALCDHRYLEFDELTAEWPRQSGKPLPDVPTV